MRQIIRLTEADIHNIVRNAVNRLIKEDSRVKAPVFGSGRGRVDYTSVLGNIAKIANLHTDRYKDNALDSAWREWANTGYNKNTEEYLAYRQAFINFMFGKYGDIQDGNGSEGFIHHIKYTLERLKNVPLHSMILDPKWSESLVKTNKWKYGGGSYMGGDEFNCFYTTILKIFQNPAIWNDFFFNPLFAEYKGMYDYARKKVLEGLKTNREQYLALLPQKEYKELNMFMSEINAETKKIEKGMNNHPERFFNPNETASNDDNPFAYIDDEF